MTPLAKYERALERHRKAAAADDTAHACSLEYKARQRALAAVERAKEALLAAGCTHPVAYLVDYQWEHDNGYGRQKWITGQRCRLCGAHQSWKGSSGWSRGD